LADLVATKHLQLGLLCYFSFNLFISFILFIILILFHFFCVILFDFNFTYLFYLFSFISGFICSDQNKFKKCKEATPEDIKKLIFDNFEDSNRFLETSEMGKEKKNKQTNKQTCKPTNEQTNKQPTNQTINRSKSKRKVVKTIGKNSNLDIK
jgi:hypothetical protein